MSSSSYFKQAKQAFKDEQYENAEYYAEHVTREDPKNIQAWICLAKSRFHMQEYVKAQQAYLKVISIEQNLPLIWKGIVDLCQKHSNESLKLQAYENLARIALNNNKIDRYCQILMDIAQGAETKGDKLREILTTFQLIQTWSKYPDDVPTEKKDDPIHLLRYWLRIFDLVDTMNLADLKDLQHEEKKLTRDFICQAIIQLGAQEDLTLVNAGFIRRMKIIIDQYGKKSIAEFHTQSSKPNIEQRLQCISICRQISRLSFAGIFVLEFLVQMSMVEASDLSVLEMEEFIRKIRLRNVDHPYVVIQNGMEAYRTDQSLEKSYELLTLGLKEFHNHFDGWMILSQILNQPSPIYNPKHALKCIENAYQVQQTIYQSFGAVPLDIERKKRQLELNRASAYAELKEWVEVDTILDTCFPDNEIGPSAPNLVEFQQYLEVLLLQQQNGKGTLEKAKQVIKAIPTTIQNFEETLQSTVGWLKYLDGQYDQAKTYLESFLQQSKHRNYEQSLGNFRLGLVYLKLGDVYVQDKNYCASHLLRAAKGNSYIFGIFRYLGQFYLEQKQNDAANSSRAEKCFIKALKLYPNDELAGLKLSQLLENSNRMEEAHDIWTDVTSRCLDKGVKWAWMKLSHYQFYHGHNAQAINSLYQAIRMDSSDALCYISLGFLYASEGRYVAAQRTLCQVLQDSSFTTSQRTAEISMLYEKIVYEIARIEGMLGLYQESIRRLNEYRSSCSPFNVHTLYYLLGSHVVQQSKHCLEKGMYGNAAVYCIEGQSFIKQAIDVSPRECMHTYKLLGDCSILAAFLSPQHFEFLKDDDDGENADLTERWLEILKTGSRAYEQALEVARVTGENISAQYYDLAMGYYYQAQARESISGTRSSGILCGENNDEGQDDDSSLKKGYWINKAMECIQQALILDPRESLYWNAFGILSKHTLHQHFAFVQSLGLVDRQHQAPTSNNSAALIWSNLIQLYLQLGDSARAKQALVQLQTVDPSSSMIWYGHGKLHQLHRLNDRDDTKAMDAYACAIDSDLHPDFCHAFAASSCEQSQDHVSQHQNPSRALFAISKTLERDPSNAAAWNVKGNLLLRCRKPALARRAFQRAMKILRPWVSSSSIGQASGARARGVYALGIVQSNYTACLIDLGQFQEAQETLDKKPVANWTSMDHVGLIQILLSREQYDAALTKLSQFEASVYHSEFLHKYIQHLRACIYYHRNQPERAYAMFQELLARDREDVTILGSIVTLMLRMSDHHNCPIIMKKNKDEDKDEQLTSFQQHIKANNASLQQLNHMVYLTFQPWIAAHDPPLSLASVDNHRVTRVFWIKYIRAFPHDLVTGRLGLASSLILQHSLKQDHDSKKNDDDYVSMALRILRSIPLSTPDATQIIAAHIQKLIQIIEWTYFSIMPKEADVRTMLQYWKHPQVRRDYIWQYLTLTLPEEGVFQRIMHVAGIYEHQGITLGALRCWKYLQQQCPRGFISAEFVALKLMQLQHQLGQTKAFEKTKTQLLEQHPGPQSAIAFIVAEFEHLSM